MKRQLTPALVAVFVAAALGLLLFESGIFQRGTSGALAASKSGNGQADNQQPATATAAGKSPDGARGARMPVLVELFTSEGCSSCPPADALVARLSEQQPVQGAQIVVLKQHVDYWNSDSWKDRFSSPEFTQRQNAYAMQFANNSVYTPQMVVDGREEFVGSDEARARRAIAAAVREPKGEVHIVRDAAKTQNGSAARWEVQIASAGPLGNNRSADVFVAVTEDKIHSEIRGGENAGRAIDHFALVRRLQKIAAVRAADLAGGKGVSFTFNLNDLTAAGWELKNLRVVVFLQEEKSGRIVAVGVAPAG